ncbi:MAG TPA: M4 family metallopeptidase, partial [Caldilineaceae bacterium]|nr:M4 family metallopeptidase [Caldilineaceae bacterium]
RRVYLNANGLDPNRLAWREGDALPYHNADPSVQSNINKIIDTSEDVYNFFAGLSGGSYRSWDGADSPMNNLYASPSLRCPNAFWTGQAVSYCLDVVSDDLIGHEWAHGYTQATHGLVYQWQPGALNEAYSDIWGETIDLINGAGNDLPDTKRSVGACTRFTHVDGSDDSLRWLAFEDARGYGQAIRDLWNPNCFGNPGKVSDTRYTCNSTDNGGVHSNSGVPNHAYALLVDGGEYNGQTIRGIGLTRAANLYWRAQTVYQTRITDFADHADSLEQACTDLIGKPLFALDTADPAATVAPETISADDCAQLSAALAAVELRKPANQCRFPTMLSPNAPALCSNEGPIKPLLQQDWEAGLAQWTVGVRDVVSPTTFSTANWAVVTTLPLTHTGAAAFVADANIGDPLTNNQRGTLYLESPPFVLPAQALAPRLAFDHWYATEENQDGGNLKISVNGGAWHLIPKTAFTFNPYNLSVQTGDGSEAVFSGTNYTTFDQGSWGQSQLRLGDLARPGDEVRLRFELHLSPAGGVHGWYVDDVQAYYCQSCGNGRINEGESCDDGNRTAGDGCSPLCQLEDGWFCKAPVSANVSRPAAPSVCLNLSTAACSTPHVAIPDDDPTGVTDVITLSQSGASNSTWRVADLDLYIEASHTWLGDLSFDLTKVESGRQLRVLDRPGSLTPGAFGGRGDDLAALFDDESTLPAEQSCTDSRPALQGNFLTGNGQGIGLATFDQDLVDGRWALTVRDHARDELGRLDRWCLIPAVPQAGAAHLLQQLVDLRQRCNPMVEHRKVKHAGPGHRRHLLALSRRE